MSSDLMCLEFERHKIRVVGTRENPQWVAADVCRVLGITNVSDTVAKFRDTEKGIDTIYTPQGGEQEMVTVTEPGLYRLVMKSRKPEAERFRVWLTHDVLPSIRQHGCYPPPEAVHKQTAIIRLDEESFARAMGRHFQVFHDAVVPRLDSIEERVDDLTTAVNSLQRRAELSDKVKRFHVQVIHRMFDGRCPCCSCERIVNEHGEKLDNLQFDHWSLRTLNGIGQTWPVCSLCNQKLRAADFHTECEVHFKSYQARRRHLEHILSPERRQLKLRFQE